MCDAVHTRESWQHAAPNQTKAGHEKKGRKKRPGCTIDRERVDSRIARTQLFFFFRFVCVWSKQEEDNDRVSRYLKVFSCVIAAAAATSCVSHARIDAPW